MQALPALQGLADQKLPGAVGFRLRRILNKVNPELENIATSRNALMTQENSVEIQGGARQVKPECTMEFLENPLFREILDLDIRPLTEDDLGEARFTQSELTSLGPLVEGGI